MELWNFMIWTYLVTNLRHCKKQHREETQFQNVVKARRHLESIMKAFSHKNGDGQDSKRRTIISCSTRQLREIPMHCCLLTERVASPAVALLSIKGEIRSNRCGEASSVMPNAAVDERKRSIRSLEAHQGGLTLWKVTFVFPKAERLLLNPWVVSSFL